MDIPIKELQRQINLFMEELQRQNVMLYKIYDLVKKQGLSTAYITVQEAAKLVKKKPTTVRRWISEGKIPAVKLNNGSQQDHYLIKRKSIEQLMSMDIF